MSRVGILSRIVIDTPCSESWDNMIGDERKRFCGRCNKFVFNIKEMSQGEAERLIGKNSSLCVRMYRRPDGTVLTKECGVGMRRRWTLKAAYGSLVLLAFGVIGIKRLAIAEDSEVLRDAAAPLETPTGRVPSEILMGEPTYLNPEAMPPPTPMPLLGKIAMPSTEENE